MSDLRPAHKPSSASTGLTGQTKWADGPYALISSTGADDSPALRAHPCYEFALEMSMVHNMILRALNAALNQAKHVQPGTQDAADFMLYNAIVYDLLHHHHETEEKYIFPVLRDITGNEAFAEGEVQQHHDFLVKAEGFAQYVKTTDREEYSPDKLKSLLHAFMPELEQHLHDEIKTLLTLRDVDPALLTNVLADAQAKALSEGDPKKTIPLVVASHDPTHPIDGVMHKSPLPWYIPYMANYVMSWKYSAAWKFCPADFWSRKRPLLGEGGRRVHA